VSSLLYQVPDRDPVAFAGAALGLAAIGMMATWLPARRAAQLDPVQAMRAE